LFWCYSFNIQSCLCLLAGLEPSSSGQRAGGGLAEQRSAGLPHRGLVEQLSCKHADWGLSGHPAEQELSEAEIRLACIVGVWWSSGLVGLWGGGRWSGDLAGPHRAGTWWAKGWGSLQSGAVVPRAYGVEAWWVSFSSVNRGIKKPSMN
jgi:hypothetical protein